MKVPNVGDVFADNYRLDEVLGEGGFATVFGATDARSQRRVALKILKPDENAGYRPDTVARFRRETEILLQLDHPHIIDEVELGQSPDGLLWIAFELLGGRDLDVMLRSRGRLEPPEVIAILRQLLSALDAAHRKGLLHRDLKPQNVRVVRESPMTVKLLDFGIARGTDHGAPQLTRTGELVGTPRYMSPEQLRGLPLGPASDIYSLGLVAFELLMGRDALSGNLITEQVDRMLSGHNFSAPELERANPALLKLVFRMLERDVERRYASASAALRALDQIVRPPGVPPPSVSNSGPISAPPPREPVLPAPSTGRTSVSSKVIAALATVSFFAVLIGLAWQRFTSEPEPEPGTPRVADVRPLPFTADEPQGRVVEEDKPSPDADATPAASPRVWDNAVRSDGCDSGREFDTTLPLREGLTALLPRDYDGGTALPVIYLLPAKKQSGAELVDSTGLKELIDGDQVILLVTEYIDGDPEPNLDSLKRQKSIAESTLCIDQSRVFAIGHREGGLAAAAIVNESWLTAVAFHSFGFRRAPLDDPPPADRDLQRFSFYEGAKPAIWISPKQSEEEPYQRKRGCDDRARHSFEEMQSIWKERNHCSEAEPEMMRQKGGTCWSFDCEVPFTSCLLDGGVAWAGTTETACKWKQESGADFPTSDVIWKFFQSAPQLELAADRGPR